MKFELWAFILKSESFLYRTTTLGAVQEWLSTFGGVHVYQHGIRVPPYGDRSNDWLEMNLIRVRSPELTPSTNTSIGRVSVDDRSELLTQKTDRSGFIDNDAFRDLRLACQDAIKWMQRRRIEQRDRRRQREKQQSTDEASKARHKMETALKAVPARSRKQVEQAFSAYDKKRARQVHNLRREVQLYRTLSTAGIASAVFAHESANNPVKVILQSTRTVRRRARALVPDDYDSKLSHPIERVLRSANALTVLSTVTLSLLRHEKRRDVRVDVYAVIQNVLDTFEPFLSTRKTKVEWEYDEGDPYLRASEAAIEAILTNLLSNSLQAFERAGPLERKILIRTHILDGSELELRVLDNGPGITGIRKGDIWLPGETTRPDGTGLGLTIVRDAVSDIGGKVDALKQGELGGAEIIIKLPIIGA